MGVVPVLNIPEEYKQAWRDFAKILIDGMPKENVSQLVTEWAEEFRVLSVGMGSRPGPYNYDVTPYLREIADCLSVSSPIMEVAFMKSTQIGATVGILENFIGYCIYHGIGPLLYVAGDQQMAEDSMATKIDDLIATSEGLSDKIKPVAIKKNNRASGDRRDIKMYSGTFLRAAGPNSESKLRSFPSLGNLIDEIDLYKQNIVNNGTSTGNPIEKILRRADAFGNQKKILYISTPKEEATSQIEPIYEQGDMREYRIPCPKCGYKQKLIWMNLEWEKDKDGKLLIEYRTIDGHEIVANDPVWYNCAGTGCGYKMRNHEKSEFMLEKGRGGDAEWVPTKKPDRPGLRSYHVNALYSPIGFRSWLEIVIQWEKVKHDALLLPDFINDVLGETWKESIEKPDQTELQGRAEPWKRGWISNEVLFLTMAVDVQGNRLEAGLLGWGRKRQGWVVDYWTFHGDPHEVNGSVWLQLEDKIRQEYYRDDGLIMNVSITFVDKQYLSSTVEAFCERFPYDPRSAANGVFPIEARETMQQSVQKVKSNIQTPVIAISDQYWKKYIFKSLNLKPSVDGQFPYGYIHISEDYGKVFYDQLLAEDFVTKTGQNNKKITIIANPKQRRNEVFDIIKYGAATLQFAIIDSFEAINNNRKTQKQKPIDINIDLFFDILEGNNTEET